jgi:hypothetical protein
MTDRPTLEADLEHHRQSGDFAAQAEMLFALGNILKDEEEYEQQANLSLGFYGQAYAAYELVEDKRGMAQVLQAMANIMINMAENHDEDTGYTEFSPIHISRIYEIVLQLYIELEDIRNQAEIYKILAHRSNTSDQAHALYANAIACYVMLDDKQEQASTYMSLSYWYSVSDPLRCSLMEHAASLYKQIDDIGMEGAAYYEMGKSSHAAKDYKAARSYFEMTQAICLVLENNEFLAFTLEALGKTILESEGYQAYLQHHAYSLNLLYTHTQGKKSYVIRNLVLELPQVACTNGDFVTARRAYLSALSYVVACKQAALQADLYWGWSIMEYEHLKRYEMAMALCQRAIALCKIYYPDYLSIFQQKLDEMRYKIANIQKSSN